MRKIRCKTLLIIVLLLLISWKITQIYTISIKFVIKQTNKKLWRSITKRHLKKKFPLTHQRLVNLFSLNLSFYPTILLVLEQLLFLVILFFIGAFLGSFLNVVSDRIPRGESILFNRSHCESCK